MTPDEHFVDFCLFAYSAKRHGLLLFAAFAIGVLLGCLFPLHR